MTQLNFDIGAGQSLAFTPSQLVIAGWTGREAAASRSSCSARSASRSPRILR